MPTTTYITQKNLGATLHRWASAPLDQREAEERLQNALSEDVSDLVTSVGLADVPMVGLYLSPAGGAIQITFNKSTDAPQRVKVTLDYFVIEGEEDVTRFVKKFSETKRK